MTTYSAPLVWPPYKFLGQQLRKKAWTLVRQQYAHLHDLREPVLWMFVDPAATPAGPGKFGYNWIGPIQGHTHIATWHVFTEEVGLYQSDAVSVSRRTLAGLLNFCDPAVPVAALQEALGCEFQQRIPQEQSFRYCEELRYVPHALVERARDTLWPELLGLAALHYCKEGLLYIAPTDVPQTLLDQAVSVHKRIYYLPLSSFRGEEQQLRHCPGLTCPLRAPLVDEDVNAAPVQAELTIRWAWMMQPFWPA